MKIYVASSWRNEFQPLVCAELREDGHDVYDFRHPAPGNDGFSWSAVDPQWQSWTPAAYLEGLKSQPAEEGGGRRERASPLNFGRNRAGCRYRSLNRMFALAATWQPVLDVGRDDVARHSRNRAVRDTPLSHLPRPLRQLADILTKQSPIAA